MEENIENSEEQTGQESSENQPTQEPQPEPTTSESQQCACGSTPEADISKDSRNLAMLCHLLGIFSGFVGSLIIWMLKKEDDPFIEANGREALNFQITVWICAAFLLVTGILVVLLLPLFLVSFIFCLIGAVKASDGKKYRYPISFRLIK